MQLRLSAFIFLALTVRAIGQEDSLRLAAVFGDHMVLQQNSTVALFGSAPPGTTVAVTASWRAESVAGQSDASGRFVVQLPTAAAGGPHHVELVCGSSRRRLEDVMLGEVWLASGQSNMEMKMKGAPGVLGGVDRADQECAAAALPGVRLFTAARRIAAAPDGDLTGTWQVCTPDTAAAFSATAFFFARRLHEDLRVPIGIVAASWGGTVAEAWTSAGGLAAFPEFAPALAQLTEQHRDRRSLAERLAGEQQAWWQELARRDAASAGAAPAADRGDTGWESCQLPARWSQSELGDLDGVVWYRRQVPLPAEWRGKAVRLELGPIDDMDTLFVDGARVAGTETMGAFATPRSYEIPATATGGEVLQLCVRVVDTGGEGGFTGPADGFAMVRQDGGARLSLAGAWQRRRGATPLPPFPAGAREQPNVPSVLWNGMIAPLVPFTFAGVIWYQGESNRERAEQYARLFPAMIEDWRRQFGRELPFCFVQIAPFGYGNDQGQAFELRLAQAAALALPRTGMAVTTDVGDARDIHPRNKQAVGDRLARHALAKVYGREVACESPRPVQVQRDGRTLRVRFDHADDGLVADGMPGPFEIAGADGVFHGALAAIDGNQVKLQADAVAEPVAVRFCFAAAAMTTVRNRAGLPVAPFQLRLDGSGH